MDPLLGMVKKEPRFRVKAKHPLVERILNVDHVVFLLQFRISLQFGWFPRLFLPQRIILSYVTIYLVM